MKFIGCRINHIRLCDLLLYIPIELEVECILAAIAYFYCISAKVKDLFSV